MAGILANSVSVTMGAGDTAVDKRISGFVTNEQITFSTTPTGTAYVWGLTKPADATVRSDLSASTGASITMTPDANGYYMVTCTVDSTTVYTIRMAVADVTPAYVTGASNYTPRDDTTIPTPATGLTLFVDEADGELKTKDSSGTVATITRT